MRSSGGTDERQGVVVQRNLRDWQPGDVHLRRRIRIIQVSQDHTFIDSF